MPVSKKVAEINSVMARNAGAVWVATLWDQYNNQRMVWMDQKKELKEYLYATDTSTTSGSTLPWKNSTTLPKLTQIFDNLYSNYMSALFPNDKWLKWEAYTKDAAKKDKARNIQAYMENKTRESKYEIETGKQVVDYIVYGNAFSTVVFEKSFHTDDIGDKVVDYIGPRKVRISPEDIVFNPLATSFKDSFKIVRSYKTLGELKRLSETDPDQAYWLDALNNRFRLRQICGGYSKDDINKVVQFQADGFGDFYTYLMGDYVEILEFYGDYYDQTSGILQTNRLITIADRSVEVRNIKIPTYSGVAPIWHVGWRTRPDNLWAMGPLDNLVGMQYRMDHLENAKADATDLIIHPPLKIIGEVEEFVWRPGEPIHIDENGDVQELGTNLSGIIQADNQIVELEGRMELYAGAPREAMGVRSPGEKTAFEIQTLDNAAGRIFQEKATRFEIELLEPDLNGMLEVGRRNFDGADTLRVLDTALGSTKFFQVTKEDITASGVIRPIGARHFAQQANEVQTLMGFVNSPIWGQIAPHTSTQQLAAFVEDVTNIRGYEIFLPNKGIMEGKMQQNLVNQAGEDLEMQASVPVETNTITPT